MCAEAIISLSRWSVSYGGGREVLTKVRMMEGVMQIETEAINLDKDHILKDKKCGNSTNR